MLLTSPSLSSLFLRYIGTGNEAESPGSNDTQETAELEAKAFELQQRTEYAAEAKSVLDSWVRYEA